MRERITIPITPPRREVYPRTPTKYEEALSGSTTFEDQTDWSNWRSMKAIIDHANQRSNRVGDGRDSLQSFCGGQRLTVTTPPGYAGAQIRVTHDLRRVPSAIVWMNSQDPNNILRGVPEGGSSGGFTNQTWTAKEIFVVANDAGGVTYEFIVA